MAGAPDEFAASISAWVKASKQRTLAVRNASIQQMVEEMQTPVSAGGNMPVATGYLRASFVAAIGRVQIGETSPDTVVGKVAIRAPGAVGPQSGTALGPVLIQAGLSDPITLGWSAKYAVHVEYGARGREGRAFARMGMQRWPQIVQQQARTAYTQVTGRAS